MALVDGFLELERSSGKLEWSAILQKMASDLGFSKILFGLLPKDSQDYENAFIVGNYPAAWREHYDRAGYARVDPTVSHCTQSVLPIFWEPSIYQTRKQHEFFEEASAAGLVYGLTMPLHGAAWCSRRTRRAEPQRGSGKPGRGQPFHGVGPADPVDAQGLDIFRGRRARAHAPRQEAGILGLPYNVPDIGCRIHIWLIG